MKTRVLLSLVVIFHVSVIFAQETWESFTTSNSAIPFNKIYCLDIDINGRVWVGNDNSGGYNHLAVFDGSGWQGYFTSNWVNDVSCSPEGQVWALHESYLKKLAGSVWEQYSPAVPLSFWSGPMYAGSGSMIWLKSNNSLYMFDGSQWTEYTIANGLPTVNITSLTGIDQELFIGTSDKGLVCFNGTAWSIYNTANSTIPSDYITAVKWKNGVLWMTDDSNNLIRFESGTFVSYNSPFLSSPKELDVDSYGNVWIASYGSGVVKFDGTAFTLYNNGNQPLLDIYNQIMSIGVDQDDNVWIGNRSSGLVVRYSGTPNNFDPNDTIRIFFLGNSFTAANNLPDMVRQLAITAGLPVFIDSYTPGGQFSLDFIQTPLVFQKFHSQPWDYVVIQDNQGAFVNTVPYIPQNYIDANLQLYDSVIAANPCCKVVWFAGWAIEGGVYPGDNTISCIQRILGNMAYLNSFVDEIVAPIGEAWIRSLNEQPLIDLFSADGMHPSPEGTFAAASVIFSVVFKTDPSGINYNDGISIANALYLRTTGYEVVTDTDNFITYNIGIVSPVLEVNGSTLSTPLTYNEYQWFLNGEIIPGATSPDYEPTEAGYYSLVVLDNNGCIRTSFPMFLADLPLAGFSWFADSLTVTFTNNSVNAASYLWDFGDGNNSSVTNPVHPYLSWGTYTVSLTATNINGSSSVSHEIILSQYPLPFNCGDTLTDTRDGKKYPTVQIGSQCWMAKNLDVGVMIPGGSNETPHTDNGTIEKFCYSNNEANCNIYGGLYQFDEMMNYIGTEASRGICPAGWHVPSTGDYDTLFSNFNVSTVAIDLQTGGTSGFEALAPGFCYFNYQQWVYGSIDQYGVLRTSTPSTSGLQYAMVYYYYPSDGTMYSESGYKKSNGYSVRCVWDGGGSGVNESEHNDIFQDPYPNPVQNVLNLAYDLKGRSDIILRITNAAGQEVFHATLNDVNGKNILRIGTNELASGHYIITLMLNDGRCFEKAFVK
jgi:uncharacterized protein (TIGR02145 family)